MIIALDTHRNEGTVGTGRQTAQFVLQMKWAIRDREHSHGRGEAGESLSATQARIQNFSCETEPWTNTRNLGGGGAESWNWKFPTPLKGLFCWSTALFDKKRTIGVWGKNPLHHHQVCHIWLSWEKKSEKMNLKSLGSGAPVQNPGSPPGREQARVSLCKLQSAVYWVPSLHSHLLQQTLGPNCLVITHIIHRQLLSGLSPIAPRYRSRMLKSNPPIHTGRVMRRSAKNGHLLHYLLLLLLQPAVWTLPLANSCFHFWRCVMQT